MGGYGMFDVDKVTEKKEKNNNIKKGKTFLKTKEKKYKKVPFGGYSVFGRG